MHLFAFKAVAPVCAAGLLLVSLPLISYAGETQVSSEPPVQSGQISTVDLHTDPGDREEPVYANVLRRRPYVSESDASGRDRGAGAENRFPSTKREESVEEEEEGTGESPYVNIPHGIQSSGQRPDEETQPAPEPVYASVKRNRRSTPRDSRRAADTTSQSSQLSPQEKSTLHQLTGVQREAGDVEPEEEEEDDYVYGEVGVKLRGQAAEQITTRLPQPCRQGSREEEESEIYSGIWSGPCRRNAAHPTTGAPPRSGLPPLQEQAEHIYSEIGAAPSTNESPLTSRQRPLQTSDDDFYSKLGARPKGKRVGRASVSPPRPSLQAPPGNEEGSIYSKVGTNHNARKAVSTTTSCPPPSLGFQREEEEGEFSTEAIRGKPVGREQQVHTSAGILRGKYPRESQTAEVQSATTGEVEAKTSQGKNTSLFTKIKRALGLNLMRKQAETTPSQIQPDSPKGAEGEEGSGMYEEVGQAQDPIYEEVGPSPTQPQEVIYAELQFRPGGLPRHRSHKHP